MQVHPDTGGGAAVEAPKPNTIDRAALVEIVRRGGTLHGEQQAKPYANSAGQTDGLDNFKRETDIRLRGFFCVKLGRCRIPVACTYNFFPFFPDEGEFTYCPDCYCFPTCLPVPMLFPVPGFGCCIWGDFHDNIYHVKAFEKRGESAQPTNGRERPLGELMIIDDERGTLACYTYPCCSSKLAKYPCVTCSRVAEPLPCHPPPAMSPEMVERYGRSS